MARRPSPTDPVRLARLGGAEPLPGPPAGSERWLLDLAEERGDTADLPDRMLELERGSHALDERGRRSPSPPPEAGRHRPSAPPVASWPARLADARWQPRWTAVLAVLMVLLAAGAVFAIRVALARSAGEPRLVTRASASPIGGATARTGGGLPAAGAVSSASGAAGSAVGTGSPLGAGPSPSPGAVPSVLLVDVDGQVRRRGVVRLLSGSRVVDALAAAGGALPSGDLTTLNQARPLVDGEQVYVPRPGEQLPVETAGGSAPGGRPTAAAGPGGAAGGPGGGGDVVDLNAATPEQLDTLPGIGPAIASRIVDWRTQHGRFSSVDELGEVQGIGPKLLERLRPHVRA